MAHLDKPLPQAEPKAEPKVQPKGSGSSKGNGSDGGSGKGKDSGSKASAVHKGDKVVEEIKRFIMDVEPGLADKFIVVRG